MHSKWIQHFWTVWRWHFANYIISVAPDIVNVIPLVDLQRLIAIAVPLISQIFVKLIWRKRSHLYFSQHVIQRAKSRSLKMFESVFRLFFDHIKSYMLSFKIGFHFLSWTEFILDLCKALTFTYQDRYRKTSKNTGMSLY